jgi:cleavage and polyadenylation specificity factor subunit 4
LRGLCKKGDLCEFLHEYNLKKMPECWFFTKYGECSNAECMYLHIDPTTKGRECVWYARGFCKHGKHFPFQGALLILLLGAGCRNRHIKKVPCPLYMVGFCPSGPHCTLAHPKFDIPVGQEQR